MSLVGLCYGVVGIYKPLNPIFTISMRLEFPMIIFNFILNTYSNSWQIIDYYGINMTIVIRVVRVNLRWVVALRCLKAIFKHFQVLFSHQLRRVKNSVHFETISIKYSIYMCRVIHALLEINS